MKKRRTGKIARTMPLIEEIFSTAQSLPLSAWSIYFAFTFPFVLGIQYFWFDMANHTIAYDRLPFGAITLTFLFIVMKTGHVFFTRRVTEQVSGIGDSPRPRLASVISNQTILQTAGVVLLPLSLLFVVPFGGLYALFQNISVLDDGRKSLRQLTHEAKEQALLNPTQNHVMLWLLCPYAVVLAATFFLILVPIMQAVSPEWTDFYLFGYSAIALTLVVPLCPFGMVVAINLGAAILMIPFLLKTLLGIDTIFTVSPSIAFTPSFFVVVTGLTYLCLDPLIKIAYSLRCFHGASVHSGQDLKANLSRIKRFATGIMIVALGAQVFVHPETAIAQSSGGSSEISAGNLDQSIEATLQDRKFEWRFPRARPEIKETGIFGTVDDFFSDTATWIWGKIKAVGDWIGDRLSPGERNSSSPGALSGQSVRGIVIVLLVALVGIMIYVGFQAWRRNQTIEVEATPVEPVVPDLSDENTTAEQLPSNEWLRLADEFMQKGEHRLAIRAYFFAGLAHMAHRRFIRLAPHKSNREYRFELQRIAHSNQGLLESFAGNLRTFESVWYGDHELTDADLGHYIEQQKWLSQHV